MLASFVSKEKGLPVKMTCISPVILAGGSGTRLWPLSRKSYPKQFSNVMGDKTLFQQTAQRLLSSAKIAFHAPITITSADFRFIVGEQLQELGIDPGAILLEPEPKNTAASILAASIFAFEKDKSAVLLISPSDHIMPDKLSFHKTVEAGLPSLEKRKIVTFGIEPKYPEVGYGYIELSKDIVGEHEASEVLQFVEKPNLINAKNMFETGNYVWNAGIFMFRAQEIIDAFKLHAPETFNLVEEAIRSAVIDLGFLRLGKEPWSKLSNVSIDYAIMEKAQNLVSVQYSSHWSDLGSWEAVWRETKKDKYGNVMSSNAHAIDCNDTLLRSENSKQQIVGLGLEKIIAIAMEDAVLVIDKDRSQDVKDVVSLLKKENIVQASIFPKDHRPWGWFESLSTGNRFQVKRIYVNPGASLSLQSHKHRSEHWIVVEGTATVTIGEDVMSIGEGQSIYVPLRARHRLENKNSSPLLLIEVQIGGYLGEDDIIRYEDKYSRVDNSHSN